MQIVRAQPSDAAALSAIARAAKAHWNYPTTWLEQWRAQLTITLEFVSANETYAAFIESRIVGFHALVVTPATVRLEHLWVLPEAMSRGIGRELFHHATERACALGASCLSIEADPNAEPFYLRMGAVRVGLRASEIEGQRRELPLLAFDLTGSRGR